MIVLIATLGVLAALMAFAGVLKLTEPHGRHEADRLGPAEVLERTEAPSPVPETSFPARIVARRITPAEMVKRYYEAAEYEMMARLDALSRHHDAVRRSLYA